MGYVAQSVTAETLLSIRSRRLEPRSKSKADYKSKKGSRRRTGRGG